MRSAGTFTGERMLWGLSRETLSYAAVALSGMCLEVTVDISPPPSFSSTSQHLSLDFLLFLSLSSAWSSPMQAARAEML